MRLFNLFALAFLVTACSTKTTVKAHEDEKASFLQIMQAQVKEAFDRIDQNGDSRLDQRELDRQIDKLFAEFDLNSDGLLTRSELEKFQRSSISVFDRNRDSKISKAEFKQAHRDWLSKLSSADLSDTFKFFRLAKREDLRLSVYKCPAFIELPGVRNQGIDLIAKSNGELEAVYKQNATYRKKFKDLDSFIKSENSSWNLPENFRLTQIREPGRLDRREQIKFELYQSGLGARIEKTSFVRVYPYVLLCSYRGEGFDLELARPIESSFCEMNSSFREPEFLNRPGLYRSVEICEGGLPETCRLSCQDPLF